MMDTTTGNINIHTPNSPGQDDTTTPRVLEELNTHVTGRLEAFSNMIKTHGAEVKTQFSDVYLKFKNLTANHKNLDSQVKDVTGIQENISAQLRESISNQEKLFNNVSTLHSDLQTMKVTQEKSNNEIHREMKNLSQTINQTSKGLDFTNKRLDSFFDDLESVSHMVFDLRNESNQRELGTSSESNNNLQKKAETLKKQFLLEWTSEDRSKDFVTVTIIQCTSG